MRPSTSMEKKSTAEKQRYWCCLVIIKQIPIFKYCGIATKCGL